MVDVGNFIDKNVFWFDVIGFTLLALLLLIVLFLNHIYLQFVTSLMLIVFGLGALTFVYLQGPIDEAKIWLLGKVTNNYVRDAINFFYRNVLVLKVLYFSLLFIVFFTLFTIIYLIFIRSSYITVFSAFVFKQNIWKILFIPVLVFALAYPVSIFTPFLSDKTKQSSHFITFLQKTEVLKITERNSEYKSVSTFEKLVKEMTDTKSKQGKKRVFVKLLVFIKKEFSSIYDQVKSNFKEIEYLDNTKEFKDVMQKATEKNIEKLLQSEDQVIKTIFEKPDGVYNKFISKHRNFGLDDLKDLKKKGIVGLLDHLYKKFQF